MKKAGKQKKQDKGPEEDDFGDNCAMLTHACEASASITNSSAHTTIEDILTAINVLSSRVDMRFTELNGVISDFKAALTEVSERVSSTEAATKSHERQLEGLEKRYDMLASQYKQQEAKLDDLEARSRRQNIRIVGIKEKTENGRPTEFVSKLLSKLLGEEHFNLPIEVDRAHRSLAPATGGKARAIIARIHYYQVKELVLRLAREKAPLQYDGRPVYIFPDLTAATMKKRQAFRAIREKCRSGSIRCGFRHPAQFVVTVNNNTGTFTTPAEAEKFFRSPALLQAGERTNVPDALSDKCCHTEGWRELSLFNKDCQFISLQ
uniref:Transposase element L1Md-A101/L1Md-A102/L1Md-A2 n=1 Tax=Dicentrarchus labrax TaxID=13489 RepID=A0A8P4K4P6_DICLA